MKPKSFTPWFKAALTVGPLALLLLSPPVDAREPHRTEGQGGQIGRPQREVNQAESAQQQSALSGPAGAPVRLRTSDRQPRRVKVDPNRQQQLSGQVVELEDQTLYVQGDGGTVVPFDVSALRFTKQPAEGQEVRVTYQVEGEQDNVALEIAGEVQPPAPEQPEQE